MFNYSDYLSTGLILNNDTLNGLEKYFTLEYEYYKEVDCYSNI